MIVNGIAGPAGAAGGAKSGIFMKNHLITTVKCLSILFLLLGLALPACAQTVVEVIPLRYRTVEQVIPVIQPLLPKDGSVSGLQGQLVVRTTKANLADIRRVLETIDVRPRRLQITVTQDVEVTRERGSAQVSGSVQIGSQGQVSTSNASATGDQVSVRVVQSRRAEADRSQQTLQVAEGNPAYIRIGQSVPIPQRQYTRQFIDGRWVEQPTGVVYQDVTSGFYVLPRVRGDEVILEISPQRERLNPSGSIEFQRGATTVSGRLGEWIEIGGVDQAASAQGSQILGRTAGSSMETRRVLVRVEEMP